MAKKPYSTFDDDKLYQEPERRHWNKKTGSGWARIVSGPDKGHWQYWHEGAKVPGKIDRSGRMDLFNFSGTGWGKGKPTPIPTEEKETTSFDGGYGTDLQSTMGFNPDSEPIIKGLTDGFTGNLGPLDGYFDETDTTNILNLYGIGNNDLVSQETGNKGGFWDKLSNSFSNPDPNLEDVAPSTPELTDADLKDKEYDEFNIQNAAKIRKQELSEGKGGGKQVESTELNQTPEDKARLAWLRESRNTPAAKAFAQDDYRNEDWGDLRWKARKRHKKLFDYNTDKEKLWYILLIKNRKT